MGGADVFVTWLRLTRRVIMDEDNTGGRFSDRDVEYLAGVGCVVPLRVPLKTVS
jgi:hypothetical protein